MPRPVDNAAQRLTALALTLALAGTACLRGCVRQSEADELR